MKRLLIILAALVLGWFGGSALAANPASPIAPYADKRAPHTYQCKDPCGCWAYGPTGKGEMGWVLFRYGDMISSTEPYHLPWWDCWKCVHCKPSHRPK